MSVAVLRAFISRHKEEHEAQLSKRTKKSPKVSQNHASESETSVKVNGSTNGEFEHSEKIPEVELNNEQDKPQEAKARVESKPPTVLEHKTDVLFYPNLVKEDDGNNAIEDAGFEAVSLQLLALPFFFICITSWAVSSLLARCCEIGGKVSVKLIKDEKNKTIKPSRLKELKEMFPNEKFLLSCGQRWTDMVLEDNATGEDALRGWLVAAYASNMEENVSKWDHLQDAYKKMKAVMRILLPEIQARRWHTDRFLDGKGIRFGF
ncbi:hypothetical protein L2E82_42761 [Cichorium intybus]|uniref:Uncharacterized protein n=1 Tax=Cichorium intybus TaxID=13427 RepID=A0ACB8ZRX8_CICIN|nr:hypothetical protein L2E82_42761 [Cichorium intybus]